MQKMAVETAEKALRLARGRIDALEEQVGDLTEKIGNLRDSLQTATEGQNLISEQLTLALVERAKLQEQMAELVKRIGIGDANVLVPPPDAIVMVNMQTGEITYANDGVFGLFGYAPSSLIGRPLEVLVPEGKRAMHTKDRAAYSEAPHARKMGSGILLQARTSQGDTVDVDISLHPTGDGRVLALVKRRYEHDAAAVTTA